jgi:hypothetical protein
MDLCESVNQYHLTHVPEQYLCSLKTRIFHLQYMQYNSHTQLQFYQFIHDYMFRLCEPLSALL